MSLSYLFN